LNEYLGATLHLRRAGVEWNQQDKAQAVAFANRTFEWGGTRQKSPVTWEKCGTRWPTQY
jgi:hypothetical protein